MKTQIEIDAANVVTAEAYKVYLVAAAARSAAADAYDVVSANRIAAIKLVNDTLKAASDAYDAYEDAMLVAGIDVSY